MRTLADRLRREIRETGPMRISDYMMRCLLDPQDGYYTKATPFGRDGDFTTSPEISQMFGEIIGVWLRMMWQALDIDKRCMLVELGPGRGTLMADILRVIAADKAMAHGLRVALVEASPRLRKTQAETLANSGFEISWLDGLADLPDEPILLVANEFFDALPIRQLVKTAQGWQERAVGLDENEAFCFTMRPANVDTSVLPKTGGQQPEGALFEYAPAREAVVAEIARRIADHGGAALLIDYGHVRSGFGDTFQAMRRHAYVDPLDDPGLADLTSHVDFERLAAVAQAAGAKAHPTLTQGDFLLAMGMERRAGALGAGKSDTVQDDIVAAVQRLAGTGPGEMGNLFKVLALTDCNQHPFPFVSKM